MTFEKVNDKEFGLNLTVKEAEYLMNSLNTCIETVEEVGGMCASGRQVTLIGGQAPDDQAVITFLVSED